MLIEINQEKDLQKITTTKGLITKEEIEKELEVNPFARFIIETEDNKIIWFVLNLITPQVTFQTQYPTFFYCMLLII